MTVVQRQRSLPFEGNAPNTLTVDQATQFARSLAEASPTKLREAVAQTFCHAVVDAYWTRTHRRRGRELRPAPTELRALRPDAIDAANALGVEAARLSIEEGSYVIGATYAAMLPPETRAKGGVFYTPAPIVRRLLNTVESEIDWSCARVLDPACGGGAFVAPVAARMIHALKGVNRRVAVRNIAARLHGQEIDPFAAWMSQVFWEATAHELLNGAGSDVPEIVDVCDSLALPRPDEFDLVIGNPPYGRISLSPEARETYRRSLFGHANMYALFLDLALRKARPGGLVAYVTPTSFLSGEYYKRLRGLLTREAPPSSFDFISERSGVFDDVLQETMLTVFRRGAALRPATVSFLEVGADSLRDQPAGEATLPGDPETPWVLPRSPAFVKTAKRLRALPDRLASWGYGVSTGPLVWNRHKPQLREAPTKKTIPLVWAECVTPDGTFSFRAERRNHAPYFEPGADDEWLVVRRGCVLLQRTTSKEQPRRLIAAELPAEFLAKHGAITVENHLNMVVPIVPEPMVSTRALAAFLNSRAADRAFRCISGSVAVSAYELEAMPLPAPGAMAALSDLLARPHSRADVERLCTTMFGCEDET